LQTSLGERTLRSSVLPWFLLGRSSEWVGLGVGLGLGSGLAFVHVAGVSHVAWMRWAEGRRLGCVQLLKNALKFCVTRPVTTHKE
jgi:hypothetical protein